VGQSVERRGEPGRGGWRVSAGARRAILEKMTEPGFDDALFVTPGAGTEHKGR